MEILTELSECYGPSGREDEIRALIKKKIEGLADEVKVDPLGNLIARKKGTGKKLMLAAHMDEVGLIVTEIDKHGFIRFAPVGNVVLTALPGTRIRFKNGTRGIISHEVTDDFLKKPEFGKLFIDIGVADREEVLKKVNIGDITSFETNLIKTKNRVIGKAMDDRIGCYILIRLLKEMDKSPFDLYFVFTVQEEIGLRGAKTSGYAITPDFAVAIDVTRAGDSPKGPTVPVKLGQGVAIKVKDRRMIASPKIRDKLVEYCETGGIKYQYEVLENGTTDAAIIQLIKTGIPTGTVSIPTRYIHTNSELLDLDDVESAIKLLNIVIKRGF